MRFIRRAYGLFLSLFLVLCCVSLSYGGDKSFIWEVQSNTTTVYIHGSIHFAKPDMYPLPKAIENGFERSRNLVLELNPVTVNQQKMHKLLMEKGMYPGNKTIIDGLTNEVFQMLERYLNKHGMPLEKFQKMRPGLLAITLSTVQIMKMGFLPQFGIDMYFALKATQAGKNIIELETIEQQLDLLLNMPDENLYLKYTLRDLNKAEKLFNDIIFLWKKGDAAGMNNIILEPYEDEPGLELILEELYFARNDKMTEKIKGFLRTDQKYFVVVGSGHLVGKRGIINQLKTANFKVTQL